MKTRNNQNREQSAQTLIKSRYVISKLKQTKVYGKNARVISANIGFTDINKSVSKDLHIKY